MFERESGRSADVDLKKKEVLQGRLESVDVDIAKWKVELSDLRDKLIPETSAQIERLKEQAASSMGDDQVALNEELNRKELMLKDQLYAREQLENEIDGHGELHDEIEADIQDASEAFKQHLN